jgi:hypothetical protein
MKKDKDNTIIKSVYIFGGKVCCRLVDNDKIFQVNSTAAYKDFLVKVNNAPLPDNSRDILTQ